MGELIGPPMYYTLSILQIINFREVEFLSKPPVPPGS